jgi:hypothetical protein
MHYESGMFLACGQRLTVEEFHGRVLEPLRLRPSQLLILVACQDAFAAATGRSGRRGC